MRLSFSSSSFLHINDYVLCFACSKPNPLIFHYTSFIFQDFFSLSYFTHFFYYDKKGEKYKYFNVALIALISHDLIALISNDKILLKRGKNDKFVLIFSPFKDQLL